MPPSKHTAAQKATAVAMYHKDGPQGPAKKYKVSPSTIVKWAKAAGVATVATGSMRAANEARTERLKALRQELYDDLLDDVKRIRKQLWEPHEDYVVGGRDGKLIKFTRDEPSFSDKRSIFSSVGTGVTSLGKLDVFDKDTNGLDAALSIVDKLIDGFGVDDSVDDEGYSDTEEGAISDDIIDDIDGTEDEDAGI